MTKWRERAEELRLRVLDMTTDEEREAYAAAFELVEAQTVADVEAEAASEAQMNYAEEIARLRAVVDVVRDEIVASGADATGPVHSCSDAACVLCRLRRMIACLPAEGA
jgi:hypothetical protein